MKEEKQKNGEIRRTYLKTNNRRNNTDCTNYNHNSNANISSGNSKYSSK